MYLMRQHDFSICLIRQNFPRFSSRTMHIFLFFKYDDDFVRNTVFLLRTMYDWSAIRMEDEIETYEIRGLGSVKQNFHVPIRDK